jgi:hypothetical protein
MKEVHLWDGSRIFCDAQDAVIRSSSDVYDVTCLACLNRKDEPKPVPDWKARIDLAYVEVLRAAVIEFRTGDLTAGQTQAPYRRHTRGS